MSVRRLLRLCAPVILAGLGAAASAAAQQGEWISLCGQCLSPSVTSKSGIGTDHAVVEAKVSRKDAEMWCASWAPGDKSETCVRQQLATNEAKDTYRATADCTKGRIMAVDGNAYTLAGTWTSDVGRGRSRWRDSAGKIVGQDEASGGLAIAQQWELLCPGPMRVNSTSGAAAKPGPPAKASPPIPAAQFSVGEVVEARYRGGWVRGKVRSIRQSTSHSAALDYEIVLENGQRGILPASMVRKLAAGTAAPNP